MIFKVTLALTREAPVELLHHKDAEDPSLVDGFTQTITLRAENATEAGTAALDVFHAHKPISDPGDFTIEATVCPLSAHEQLAMEPFQGPILSDEFLL